MLKDTFRAQSEEIVVDMFAGAGGASCGLEMADIHVHAAINHDPVAVSLHARNHPETEHHVQDVLYPLAAVGDARPARRAPLDVAGLHASLQGQGRRADAQRPAA